MDITINKEKNGIELRFKSKPSAEVTSVLNSVGFKYSYRQTIWYAQLTDQRKSFAISLQSVLDQGKDLSEVEIQPAYAPSQENIDSRNFSYVSLGYKDEQGLQQTSPFLVFEPSKKMAELLAKRAGKRLFGEDFTQALVYPRNYKRKARALLEKGQLLPLGASAIDSLEKSLEVQNRVENQKATSIPVEPPKKDKHSLNLEIEEFIRQKDQAGTPYTVEDIQFIKKYRGAGGLAAKGATGHGLLYEFYTPEAVVERMWGLAYKYGYQDDDVLEPAVGTGNFLKYAPSQTKVVGYETNPTSRRICEIQYPSAIIHNRAFESHFFAGNVHLKNDYEQPNYGLVIGNPPYGEFTGKYAGMGEKKWTSARTYQEYFITRCLDLLRPEGLLLFIVPSSFLQGGNTKVKENIASKAFPLVDAYRLPNGIFSETAIGTDILVLRKKQAA